MSGAFDAWLLIVGLVVGAGLSWLVLADSNRREVDVVEEELPSEAAWIASSLAEEGVRIDQPTAERVLRLHRTYLASLPPDDPLAEPELGAEPVADASAAPSTAAATASTEASTGAASTSAVSASTATSTATGSPAATEPTPPPARPRSTTRRTPTTDPAGPARDAVP